MKPLKLITSLAAVACALAVSSARAQITNLVTFDILTYTQGPTNDNGTTTTLSVTKAPHSASQLLHEELGPLLNTNGLSSAAKLVVISFAGFGGPAFGVVDGTNFYGLSNSNVMTIAAPVNYIIKSGAHSDTSIQRKVGDMEEVIVSYDDTPIGGTLRFSLRGIATISQTDTVPSNGTYMETLKVKISDLAGEGTSDGKAFGATGFMNISGKGTLLIL